MRPAGGGGAVGVVRGGVDPRVTRGVGLGIVCAVEVAILLHKWLRLYHPDIDFDLFAALGEKWAVFRRYYTIERSTKEAAVKALE